MLVYLNGRFVPDEEAVVSIHDRGFLYGDSLFETIRVYGGAPFLFARHMDRFFAGARELRMGPPLSGGETGRVLGELLARNGLAEAVARITLSRGCGARGYSPRGALGPTFAMALSPAPAKLPAAFDVVASGHRLFSGDGLARFKHGSRLPQVAARMEADDRGADEALLLNEAGQVMEGSSSNVFWVRGGMLGTTPLSQGILPGVTRQYVYDLAAELGIGRGEELITPEELAGCEGVFLTSSALEVMEVARLDGRLLGRSPIVRKIKALYRRAVSG